MNLNGGIAQSVNADTHSLSHLCQSLMATCQLARVPANLMQTTGMHSV